MRAASGPGAQLAAMVSTESGSEGGQYPLAFATWDEATLITTTSGPGVSGMCGTCSTCRPRVPSTVCNSDALRVSETTARQIEKVLRYRTSQTVMSPLPGRKTFTQSLNWPNLKSAQVWVMAGGPAWLICTSTWLATGIVCPKRMHLYNHTR